MVKQPRQAGSLRAGEVVACQFGDVIIELTRKSRLGQDRSMLQRRLTVAADALVWWRSIPSNPNRGGILVHGGAEGFVFNGCRVLPWFLR